LENYKILQDTILKPEKEDMSGKTWTYRMSQEECAILRESVPYVKLY